MWNATSSMHTTNSEEYSSGILGVALERQRHRYGPEGQDWADIAVHYRGVQPR